MKIQKTLAYLLSFANLYFGNYRTSAIIYLLLDHVSLSKTSYNGRYSDFKLQEESPDLTCDNVILLHCKRHWDDHHEVRRYTKYYF